MDVVFEAVGEAIALGLTFLLRAFFFFSPLLAGWGSRREATPSAFGSGWGNCGAWTGLEFYTLEGEPRSWVRQLHSGSNIRITLNF